jgi:CheY-like chemotaxis protein
MSKFKPVNILLVEDDVVDATAVKRMFASRHIANNIIVARDGIEALELLRRDQISQPRVILLDLKLPRMDGIEFLGELRRDPMLKSQVVFVLTSSRAEADRKAAYGHNIAGYIVKSEADEGFLNLVNMLDHYWQVVEMPTETEDASIS